jgi:MoaA/NifB/PqqE/SkfB family radical SAM enzyme
MAKITSERYLDVSARVTLIDPKTLENYDLYFRLYNVPLAKKWINEMYRLKKNNFSFRERKIHHKNFKITPEFVDQFNKTIKQINKFYDQPLKYPITELTQDILNELHDAYAVYGQRNHAKLKEKWWDTAYLNYDADHFYAHRWPGITFNEGMHHAFVKLNDLIHSSEVALKEDWKDASEFIGVSSYNPRNNYELEQEDLFCLKPFLDFGDLCVGYNTLGKSLKHVVYDEDEESLKKNLVIPQTTWSNEILFHMCPSDNTPEGYKFYWERWNKINPEKYGFNYGEFYKNREGYYNIGTLTGQQKEDLWSMRHDTMKIDLSRFTDIYDISIISSIDARNEYNNPDLRKPVWKKLAPIQGKTIVSIDNPQEAIVTWVLNDICNYSCRYCPPGLHNGKNYKNDWDTVEPFISHVIDILADDTRKIVFSLSGGEPTLSPFFPQLVKKIYELGHYTRLTTNLARTPRFIEEHFKYLLGVSCSFHPAFEFKNKTDQEYIEKVKVCTEVTNTSVRVMMDPLYWDQCVEFIDRVRAETTASVDIVMIEDQYGNSAIKLCDISYTADQLEFFKNFKTGSAQHKPVRNYTVTSNLSKPLLTYEDGTTGYSKGSWQTLINNGQTRFYGYNCAIGKESMFIHQGGGIRKANCHVGGREIGKISEWEKINWIDFKKEVVCTQRSCTCGADVPITKYLEK